MNIWDNIKTVTLLFESDKQEGNTDIQQLILQMRSIGKEVNAWGYVSKRKIASPANKIFRIVGKEDTTIFGKLTTQTLKIWETMEVDLLLDLTTHDFRPLLQLAATAHATYKAGKKRARPYLHDFMIEITKKQTRVELYEQIVYYLQLLEQKA